MSLIKINDLKYKIEDKGEIYIKGQYLYFDIDNKTLMDIFDSFIKKIKDKLPNNYILYKGDNPYLRDIYLKFDQETIIIYMKDYIYKVSSDYLFPKDYRKILKSRGNWKEDIINNRTDLLYIQGPESRKEKKPKAFLTNMVDRKSIDQTKKDLVHNLIAPNLREKFTCPKIRFTLTPDFKISTVKEFIEENKPVILKPIEGWGGFNISVLNNYKEFQKTIKKLKEEKERDNWSKTKDQKNNWITNLYWIIEKYIEDPHLYQGKKYHARVYFFHTNHKKSFIYNTFRLAIAEEEYKKEDLGNKKIHDTHFVVKDQTNLVYLDQILNKEEYQYVLEQILMIFNSISRNLQLSCHHQNKHCFETFAADIMLEKDLTVKLIELNTNPGFNKNLPLPLHIFENIMYHIVDKIFPPKIEQEDPEGFIAVHDRSSNPRGSLEDKEYNKKLTFIDQLALSWYKEGYGPKAKKDKTGGYYLTCKTGKLDDFHIHIVGPGGKIHLNSWSRKVKDKRKWEPLDFRLTAKEQAYHIYSKSDYRKNKVCLDYYENHGKDK